MLKLLSSTATLLTVVCAAVFSQAPPDQPGRPAGPGLGGFFSPGRGMFRGPGLGQPGLEASGLALLGLPEVHAELGVTDDQQKRIDELADASQQEVRNALSEFNPAELFDLDEKERQQRMDDFRRRSEAAAEKADARLAKLLTKPQAARLAELRLQREGPPALLRSDLARQLELSGDQQSRLVELEQAGQPQLGPGFGGPPDFARTEQTRQKAHAEMLAVLTDAQKSKWESLLGKPFTFPRLQFGPGGPGGPMGGQERKLIAQFDKDGDKRLNNAERQAARETLKRDRPAAGRGFGPPGGGFGGPPGRGNREPSQPGAKVSPADVKSHPDAKLYEPTVLRTLFLEFENDDWETELADFHNSDVEVPAALTVDGVTYPNVGVHFRGMSSYGAVPQGYKRSLNVALDHADANQRLYGYKTLNLLNCHEDPSCLSSVLYSHIARKYLPAPQSNLVKVVINGENWGVYANVQQFNKEFLAENYQSTKGNRWKVSGSPGGGGGLDYVGDNIEDYRQRYEIKSGDSEKAWKNLIKLCRTLNETPIEQLPAAIEPMLDVDSLLWFLALDVSLINNDGYWVRASDYSLYQDDKGKFHVIPHDMNEAFHGAMMMGFGGPGGMRGGRPDGVPPGIGGPNGPGGPPGRTNGPGGPPPGGPGSPGRFGGMGPRGGGGMELDPLVALDDPRKPLRSKVLAVPEYRTRYLQYVRTIAEESLDWKTLGPVVAQFRSLIEDEVRQDTRKLDSFEAFDRVTADQPSEERPRGREMPLRTFADQRRTYLLGHPEIRTLTP